MMTSIKPKVLRFLTGRIFISFLNIAFAFIGIRVFIASLPLLSAHSTQNSEALEVLLDGIDNILVSYGVILEERGFIMRFLKFYPLLLNPREELTDHSCEAYGIVFLILGLLMELPDKQISLPNDIVNTAGLETGLYSLAILGVAECEYGLPSSPTLLPREKGARNLLFPLPRERVRVRVDPSFILRFSNAQFC